MTKILRLVFSAVLVCLLSLVHNVAAEGTDESYIRQTFQLATSALEKGNHPSGAILVKDGRVIMKAANSVRTDNSITHHAEMNVMEAASRMFGPAAVAGSTLYTSCEPCAMCSGAMYNSGIKRLVYGLSAERLSSMVRLGEIFPSRLFFYTAGVQVEIKGPVLEEEAADLITRYVERQKTTAEKK